MIDLNPLMLEDLRRLQEEERNREMRFKEKYHLYEEVSRKKICLDLKVIKVCI